MRLDLQRFVVRHVLGLFAASQATVAVALHAGWIFLALATLLIPDGAAGTHGQALGRALLKGLELIGALDVDGQHRRGDLTTVMRAFATLTPLVYVLKLLLDHLRKGRAPWSVPRKALLSGAVAAAGYIGAFATLPGTGGVPWPVVAVFAVLAGLGTLWALLVGLFCDRVEDHFARPDAGPRPA